MPRKDETKKTTVLYVRDFPIELSRKLRAVAALSGSRGMRTYLIEILQAHVADLEKKGLLPKGKG